MKTKITLICMLVCCFIMQGKAQINFKDIKIVDGPLDYTKYSRVCIQYSTSEQKILEYKQFLRMTDDCRTISSIQFLPGLKDIDLYYPLQPVDCSALTGIKPVFKISMVNKYDPPSLGFDRTIDPATLTYFIKNPEIDHYLEYVCEKIKIPELAERFNLVGASVPTFAEYRKINNGYINCYLLYNPDTLIRLLRTADTMVLYGIMFHEFGHILKQHSSSRDLSNISSELEADEYAGRMLHVIGADSITIFRMLAFIPDTGIIENYPSKEERKKKILSGWKKEDNERQQARAMSTNLEYRQLDSVRTNLFNLQKYRETIKFLGQNNYSGDTNRLLDFRMLGESYFALAGKPGSRNITSDYSNAVHYFGEYLKYKEDPDIYYKFAQSFYYFRDFAHADSNFQKALLLTNDRLKKASSYYYIGACRKELNYYNASEENFDMSLELDPSNLNAYEKRGEIKKIIFTDSLSVAIDDYYEAWKLAVSSDDRMRLSDSIKNISSRFYRKSIRLSPPEPSKTYKALQYLQNNHADTLIPLFNAGMAFCFWSMYDSINKTGFYPDSIIYYSTKYLDKKPAKNTRSYLLRGRTWYMYYKIKPDLRYLANAFSDLANIPENKPEYNETAWLKSKMDIINKDYTNLLYRYERNRSPFFKEKIKNEMCNLFREIDDSKTISRKDKATIKKICQGN